MLSSALFGKYLCLLEKNLDLPFHGTTSIIKKINGERMDKSMKIPKATITRLSLYCRQLELLEFDGYRMVSSEKLAWLCQVNPAQVRKDLGYFGEFGVRGVGYDVRDLMLEIKKILAVNRDWNMGIVGVGNLGSALLQNQNFPARGFYFVAAFDSDAEKIGKNVFPGLVIRNVEKLKDTVEDSDIEIGVITTPASVAQGIADLFLEANVNALLNFSPTQLHVPEGCLVESIDFTIKLDILTYKLKHELRI
jgi:redox-sensing transcriptional repressor